MKTNTPLYLRDLIKECQVDWVKTIKEKRKDLIEALQNGEDITVGYYCTDSEMEVAK